MITLKSVPNQQAEFYFFNQRNLFDNYERKERRVFFFLFEIVYSTCGGIFLRLHVLDTPYIVQPDGLYIMHLH